MAAHQAPPSLGFSRQEHWSGLPFPSPMHDSEKWKWRRSVVSDSSWPHGLQPPSLLHPWDFPGKGTGVGCHCLLHFRGLATINSAVVNIVVHVYFYLMFFSAYMPSSGIAGYMVVLFFKEPSYCSSYWGGKESGMDWEIGIGIYTILCLK